MKRMLFLVIFTCLFVLIGCSEQPSEKVLRYQENNEIIGPEKDEIIGEVSDTIYDSIDRSNSKAEEIIIGPIEGPMEEVIPPEGRYTVTPYSPNGYPQAGRVLVYDNDGVLLANEILSFSIGSFTVDLSGSHTVQVDGLDMALLTPVNTEVSTQLTAGIWEVGKDIEAGDYSAYAENEFGYLHIFEEGKSPRLFEFLNTSPESKIDLQLTEGQKLRVNGLSMLQFNPTK